jgi:hypothetical protein
VGPGEGTSLGHHLTIPHILKGSSVIINLEIIHKDSTENLLKKIPPKISFRQRFSQAITLKKT